MRRGAFAARADALLARLDVAETANANMTAVHFCITSWQRAREAVAAQMAALEKLRRGHQLGEIDLSDMLLGTRMVHDAFRREAEARAEAMPAVTKLRIDAHDLWLGD